MQNNTAVASLTRWCCTSPPLPPAPHRNLLAFCIIACLHPGRLSLRTQILNPLLIILLLLSATAALALRLDLPGTVVAYFSLPTLAVLVRQHVAGLCTQLHASQKLVLLQELLCGGSELMSFRLKS